MICPHSWGGSGMEQPQNEFLARVEVGDRKVRNNAALVTVCRIRSMPMSQAGLDLGRCGRQQWLLIGFAYGSSSFWNNAPTSSTAIFAEM
jgi:hypothetical protein